MQGVGHDSRHPSGSTRGFDFWRQLQTSRCKRKLRPARACRVPRPRPDGPELLLQIIGHDLDRTFRSPQASEAVGSEANAAALERLWLDGQDYYLGLSTDSELVIAEDTNAGFQLI